MDSFVENLSQIKNIARRIIAQHCGIYEVDELVNAAYVKFDRAITNNPALIEEKFSKLSTFFYRIKMDMKDYIRDESKFRIKQRLEKKGLDVPDFATASFQVPEDENIHDFFEPFNTEYGYAQVEIKDYIHELCSFTPLSDDEWAIIQGYFYDERPLKEVSEEIGVKQCTGSLKKKKMLKKLLTYTENMV